MSSISMAHTRATKLQSEGQTAYRNKDYSKALQLLTQALEIHATPVILQLCILDNRAAVQEKIGGEVHLRGALSDARQMIKLQKSHVNGYLRAGKILQLQGSYQNAADIYKYGLEKLAPADEDGRRLLGRMYGKVLARLEARKTEKKVDMISVLPVELLEMVIEFIPFPSLMVAQGVSKSWQKFLLNCPKTFSVLDFSCAKKPLERTTIRLAVNRSKNSIKKARFNKLQPRGVEELIYLARVSPLLTELQLLGYEQPLPVVEIVKHTKNLKSLIIKSSVRTEHISEILTRCLALECFECFDVNHMGFRGWKLEKSKLRRLYLRIVREEHYPSDRMLSSLLALLPELRELEISEYSPRVSPQLDFTAAPHLAVLNLRKISTTNFPLLPITIKHLTLAHLPNLNITPDDILKSPLPELKEFDISYNPHITNDILLLLLGTLSPRKLILDMCPRLNFETIDWLLKCGGKLEELSVIGNSTFSDSVSKEMGRFKILRRLNIGNTQITGIGLLNLVRVSRKDGHGGGLQYVGCDHCEGVGYDAVEVARRMGVTISHRMSAEYARGGRRIRYGE